MQGGASSSHHYDMKHEMDDSDDLSGEWSPPFLRFSFFSDGTQKWPISSWDEYYKALNPNRNRNCNRNCGRFGRMSTIEALRL